MSANVRPSRHSRTRRQLPERVERLRWLRDAVRDPAGCMRETEVDGAIIRVRAADGGQVELRVEPIEAAQQLADEFFGRRYRSRRESGSVVFIGRPL